MTLMIMLIWRVIILKKDNDATIVNFGNHYNDNDGNDYAGSCGVIMMIVMIFMVSVMIE